MDDMLLRKVQVFVVGLVVAGVAHASAADEARCIEISARYNHLPPGLLLAVRQQEGGQAGYWRLNQDGSYDYGVMQINSRWLPVLASSGYSASAMIYDTCASIAVGAWMLAQALASHRVWNQPDAEPHAYWRAVGDYHSHTLRLNRGYADQVWRRYKQHSPKP